LITFVTSTLGPARTARTPGPYIELLTSYRRVSCEARLKEAVKWQMRALEIGYEGKEDEEKARKRLKLSEAGKPYRDKEP
jgi:hypothetical protein